MNYYFTLFCFLVVETCGFFFRIYCLILQVLQDLKINALRWFQVIILTRLKIVLVKEPKYLPPPPHFILCILIRFGLISLVMHIALRSPKDKEFYVDGENVVPKVHEVLDKVIISYYKFILLNYLFKLFFFSLSFSFP